MAKLPKRRELKGPGICVFCGRVAGTHEGDITVSMSKQHLWPEWLQALFPNSEVSHTSYQIYRWAEAGKGLKIDPRINKHNGDVKSRKIRIVCQHNCNNGWISVAENRVKNILTRIFNDENFKINRDEQEYLALWVSIISVMFEYTDLPTKIISPGERSFIYQEKSAPPDWSIWIGRYRGSEWKNRYRHHGLSGLIEFNAADEFFGHRMDVGHQTSTFQIGGLFIYVSSSEVPFIANYEKSIRIIGMQRVWPITSNFINWPPAFIIDDVSAMNISDRILVTSASMMLVD